MPLRTFWFTIIASHALYDDATMKQIKDVSLTLRRLNQCDHTLVLQVKSAYLGNKTLRVFFPVRFESIKVE